MIQQTEGIGDMGQNLKRSILSCHHNYAQLEISFNPTCTMAEGTYLMYLDFMEMWKPLSSFWGQVDNNRRTLLLSLSVQGNQKSKVKNKKSKVKTSEDMALALSFPFHLRREAS